MRNRADPLTLRVLEASRLKPMTAGEIAAALCVGENAVRQVLQHMEKQKRVRRAGLAPAKPRGIRPYLWSPV